MAHRVCVRLPVRVADMSNREMDREHCTRVVQAIGEESWAASPSSTSRLNGKRRQEREPMAPRFIDGVMTR